MGSEAVADSFQTRIKCRPFLKWAGGKKQLLPQLMSRIPESFGTYYEPFLGGGALFFELQPELACISDINTELVNCYKVVKNAPSELIKALSQHRYESEHYYSVRNIDRHDDYLSWSSVQRASRLIYLNKTCFNGLYRVNSSGHFNVPFGRHKNPTICDTENLLACSAVLSKIQIEEVSFESILTRVEANDFVYLDPPYAPVSLTSNFTAYAKDGFNSDMQHKLREVCVALDGKGVRFMLSNSSAPQILELYKNFNLELVTASRAINSKANLRGVVDEVIVRNY